jgi:ABC-type multidrug transport system fused ATPase/permease subunit
MNKPAFSAYVSLALRVVGIIIVALILDYIILAVPFQPLDSDWQIAFTRQIVDRGIVPMIGIAFLIAGYWLQEYWTGKSQRISLGDLRLWTLIFSSVMGLIFFLLVPLHLSNLSFVRGRAIAQIEGRFNAAERQIQNQFDFIKEQPSHLDRWQEMYEKGEITASRLEQLKEILPQLTGGENPIGQQYDQAMTQLGDRRQEAENQAKTNVLKSGFRIGVQSLLLAIGYTIIGWTGLQGLAGGGSLPLSRQVRAR